MIRLGEDRRGEHLPRARSAGATPSSAPRSRRRGSARPQSRARAERPDADVPARELLGDDAHRDLAEPQPAVLLGDREAEDSELAQLRHEVERDEDVLAGGSPARSASPRGPRTSETRAAKPRASRPSSPSAPPPFSRANAASSRYRSRARLVVGPLRERRSARSSARRRPRRSRARSAGWSRSARGRSPREATARAPRDTSRRRAARTVPPSFVCATSPAHLLEPARRLVFRHQVRERVRPELLPVELRRRDLRPLEDAAPQPVAPASDRASRARGTRGRTRRAHTMWSSFAVFSSSLPSA